MRLLRILRDPASFNSLVRSSISRPHQAWIATCAERDRRDVLSVGGLLSVVFHNEVMPGHFNRLVVIPRTLFRDKGSSFSLASSLLPVPWRGTVVPDSSRNLERRVLLQQLVLLIVLLARQG